MSYLVSLSCGIVNKVCQMWRNSLMNCDEYDVIGLWEESQLKKVYGKSSISIHR